MAPTAVEVGGLALIVGMMALAQRLGGWENKPLARGLGLVAAALFVAWCFLFFPDWLAWLAWASAAITSSICLWFIFTWLRPPKRTSDPAQAVGPTVASETPLPLQESFEPELAFGLKYHGPPPGESQAWSQSVVVGVKNRQVAIANTAKNTTARLQFVHADGTTFTVTAAAWLVEKTGEGGILQSSISGSTDLEGGEEQPFVLLLIRREDRSIWAFGNRGVPIGMCGVGRWIANVRVICDNARILQGSIGFYVLRGNELQFDQPAFLSRSDQ